MAAIWNVPENVQRAITSKKRDKRHYVSSFITFFRVTLNRLHQFANIFNLWSACCRDIQAACAFPIFTIQLPGDIWYQAMTHYHFKHSDFWFMSHFLITILNAQNGPIFWNVKWKARINIYGSRTWTMSLYFIIVFAPECFLHCYFWTDWDHPYTKMTGLMSTTQKKNCFRSWRHWWRHKRNLWRHIGFKTWKHHNFVVFQSIWTIDTPKSRYWNELSKK